ncbi:2-dehydro-3-deoxygluconokinase [Anaerotaenia torta]|uniref:sugar kinase n=1 Tax=Anaerotaenia torta TaxID=433293 RepID=UPI003D2374CE
MPEDKRVFDLLALGEILLRLSPPNGERLVRGDLLQKQTGGAELNVVSGVSMLGLHTGIISKIPSNDIGFFVKNYIRFCGVSDDYLIYDDREDARLGVYFYENGAHPRKPAIVYDRLNSSMRTLKVDEIPEEIFSSARCFHTSGITLALNENIRNTAVELIKRFKANGTIISFDVNFRRNLWTGEEARICIEQILPYVDIFFCSEDTARLTFLAEGSAYAIMKDFTDKYPISIVASTQRIVHSPKSHTFGSVIYSKAEDQYYEEEPYQNIEVIDRIGSGDAYVSGVLYGLLNHNFDCRRALEYGNASSAMKSTIPGDLPSCNLKEIDQLIQSHKMTGKQSEMNR